MRVQVVEGDIPQAQQQMTVCLKQAEHTSVTLGIKAGDIFNQMRKQEAEPRLAAAGLI